jgi:hypothetical protein
LFSFVGAYSFKPLSLRGAPRIAKCKLQNGNWSGNRPSICILQFAMFDCLNTQRYLVSTVRNIRLSNAEHSLVENLVALVVALRQPVKPFLTRGTKSLSFRHNVANLPAGVEARKAQGAACRHNKQPKEEGAWLLFGFWRARGNPAANPNLELL